MPTPEVDRIFLENPNLDRDVFERNQKKIDETKHIPKPARKGGRLRNLCTSHPPVILI